MVTNICWFAGRVGISKRAAVCIGVVGKRNKVRVVDNLNRRIPLKDYDGSCVEPPWTYSNAPSVVSQIWA